MQSFLDGSTVVLAHLPRLPPEGATAEVARELCYRLYTLCERKKHAAEALSYNSLVQSWPDIAGLAPEEREHEAEKTSLVVTEDG